MTRILGVDPGLTRLGVGVIDHSRGRDVSLVMVDVFTTPTEWDVAKRLLSLQGQLREVLDEFQPARVSLERVFAQHNVRTVMGTAQVSGILLALAAERGIPVAHRTPSEVKAAVTGFGGAKKPQVGQMVKNILQLDQVPKPADAADALALAITEAWRGSPDVGEDRPETPAQRAWREALRPRGT